jgi:hypothetical protein
MSKSCAQNSNRKPSNGSYQASPTATLTPVAKSADLQSKLDGVHLKLGFMKSEFTQNTETSDTSSSFDKLSLTDRSSEFFCLL